MSEELAEEAPPGRHGSPADEQTREIRASMERHFATLATAPGHRAVDGELGGRPALWVERDEPHGPGAPGRAGEVAGAGRAGGAVLHLHGGGYRAGSVRTALGLTSRIAVDTGLAVVSLDYRLAPEHPYPAAPADALAAYRALLGRYGGDARRIGVLGESAGGGLVVALLLAVRAAGLPQPAAAVALSPWLDLANSSDAHRRFADTDRVFDAERSRASARAYLAEADPRDPPASPAYAPRSELGALAPLLVHVAADEVLVDEAADFAAAVASAGGSIQLARIKGVFHMWHVYCGQLPAAAESAAEVSAFLSARIAAPRPAEA
jgi:acetyl esterase/lipase